MDKKKIKVYKLQVSSDIDDTTGVSVISIVNAPAIQKNFVAFDSEGSAKQYKFSVTNKAQQIVTGPIMVPDLPIYRNDKDATGKVIDEWFVLATKEVISAVIQKFFKTQRNANTSLEHNGILLNGVYLIESFQVDKNRGISAPVGYGDIPDGTWFGSMKVENPEIWAEIEAGTFKGFSIEGLFTYEPTSAVVVKQSSLSEFFELQGVLNSLSSLT